MICQSNNESSNYNCIDLFKFLFAICVIAIHTQPLDSFRGSTLYSIYVTIVNCAVPFFFMATGFLVFGKLKWPYTDDKALHKIKENIKKAISLYVVWNIIYLPVAIYHYTQQDHPILLCILHYIRGLFFTGEHYNSWILWYLLSLIYSLAIIYFLLKRKCNPRVLCLVAFLLFMFGVGLDWFQAQNFSSNLRLSSTQKIIANTFERGRLFKGMFYISSGMILSRINIQNRFVPLVLIIASIILRATTNIPFISQILITICSVSIFIMVKNTRIRDSKVFFILRKTSTHLFFIHLLIWTLLYTIVYGEKTFGPISFIGTFALSLSFSLIFLAITSRAKQGKKSSNT